MTGPVIILGLLALPALVFVVIWILAVKKSVDEETRKRERGFEVKPNPGPQPVTREDEDRD